MLRILLLLAALVLLLVYLNRWRKLEMAQRRKHIYVVVVVVFLAGLLFLTLTGRLHGLVAMGAALIPFVRRLLWLIKMLPFVRKLMGKKAKETQGRASPPVSTSMSRVDALKVLGLEEGATEQQIRQAHRALMQKLHPDHGGNDFLAAQLNQARDVLLASYSEHKD